MTKYTDTQNERFDILTQIDTLFVVHNPSSLFSSIVGPSTQSGGIKNDVGIIIILEGSSVESSTVLTQVFRHYRRTTVGGKTSQFEVVCK